MKHEINRCLRLGALILALCGTATVAADEREWVEGWRETAPLGTARAGAAVAVHGDSVYVMGGVDGRRFLASVERARIRPDGTLSAWEPAGSLTEARGFFDAVVHDRHVYVAGGANGPGGRNLLASVERAPILEDGRLGPWERLDARMNLTRRCVKLAVTGDALYAIGGFGGRLLDSVERARFLPAGGLGAFRLEPNPTTIPRYVNSVATTGGSIVALGGHREMEGTGIAAVEVASTSAGEGLVWRAAAPLARGRYGLASAATDDALYALGGLDGPVYLDAVEVATLDADGVPTAWRETTALPEPRANFAAFAHGGRIYIVGGTNRDGYFDSVAFAEPGPDGTLGFRATPQEAEAHRRLRGETQQARATTPALPNAGTVREVLQTPTYSYLLVEDAEGALWIAGPRGDYAAGDHVGYSRGTPMGEFYSRALGRTFERILFVETIAPVGQKVEPNVSR